MQNNNNNIKSEKDKTLFDRFCQWLIEILTNRNQESSIIKKFLNFLKSLLIVSTVLYVFILMLSYAGIELIGEYWWFTAFLCYLPQTIWLIPASILAIGYLILLRKFLFIPTGMIIFIALAFMKFNLSFFNPQIHPDIIVMTNNIGQDNKQSLTNFIKTENPDIILLQESAGRTRRFTNSFPQFSCVQTGEFGILSKYKILNSEAIQSPEKSWVTLGARYEIQLSNTVIAVYNVHIPSPRTDLQKTFGRGLIIALIGTALDNGRFGKYKNDLQTNWLQRVRYYEYLNSLIEKEDKPFIVGGDFNLPDSGPIYRMLCKKMNDAFRECGSGFGYTFPGETLNPLSLFGPWLRIDYLFSGKGFSPVYARVEPRRKSQHRAVVAGFKIESQQNNNK